MQAMGLMADRIDQLDRKLAGMMLTGPAGLNADLQDSTPIQLSRAGYSQKTILRLQPSYAGLGYETGVSSFLDCLAEDLTDLKAKRCCRNGDFCCRGNRLWPHHAGLEAGGEPERCPSRQGSRPGQPVHNLE